MNFQRTLIYTSVVLLLATPVAMGANQTKKIINQDIVNDIKNKTS
jgi:hypothetical protein